MESGPAINKTPLSFKRNISSFNQLKLLIKSIKKVTRDKKYPILIDEEGGSVSRMSKLFNNNVYSQKFFANIYNSDKKIGIFLYKNYISSICSIFKLLGINGLQNEIIKNNNSKILQKRINRFFTLFLNPFILSILLINFILLNLMSVRFLRLKK